MDTSEKRPSDSPEIEDERGNELGYRNVDEDKDHDERGSQGPDPNEPPADET